MKYLFNILAFAVICLQTSCIKDALNVEVPSIPSKMVVTSFISPDDTLLLVLVTRSIPLNEYPDQKKNENLKFAKVVLSDGDQQVILTSFDFNSNTDFNFYYIDPNTVFFQASPDSFPIKAGKTYQLTVTDVDGVSVTAFTTVPLNKNSSEMARFYKTAESNGGGEYRVDLECIDLPGETNYYRMDLELKKSSRCYGYVNFDEQSTLLSDLGNDGSTLKLRNGVFYSSCRIEGDSVDLLLANVDFHYYRYQVSLRNYEGDNPFSEPAAIYSNIQGGLGAFGSFNLFRKRVPFVLQ